MNAPILAPVFEKVAPDAAADYAVTSPKKTRERAVNIKCASDIKAQPITWLWHGWLPAGKFTLLAAPAGTGKTTLAMSLAATLTSGGKWPDGTQCREKGNVLIWSSEDSAADTLVPRLLAAGADMDRCHFIESITENGEKVPFDPSVDIHELHKAVEQIGGVSLLIIDPILSAVDGDMNRPNVVRRCLQELVDFGELHGCAIFGVSHFAKYGAGKTPQDRVIGSQAFVALARMVLVAAKDEGSDRRVFARAKSNIAADDGGFAYLLKIVALDGGIETTHVVWDGVVQGTAREILGDVEHDENEDGSEKADAEQFLEGLLAQGSVPTKQIKADSDGAGYSWATIRRAQKSLEITAFKGGMKDGWHWKLPDTDRRCSRNNEDAHTNSVSTFDKSERLRDNLQMKDADL